MMIEVKVFDEENTGVVEPRILNAFVVEVNNGNVSSPSLSGAAITPAHINCATLDEVCKSLLDGEPVFILRAQDKFAPEHIRAYRDALKEKKNKVWKRVDAALKAINSWRKDNKTRIKIPD